MIHILGVPHTVTDMRFSHCAFTQKVARFVPMMMAQGFDVVHYGVGANNPGATGHFQVMSEGRQVALLGHDHDEGISGKRFWGDDANVGNALYLEFNRRLSMLLKDNVEPGDFVCMPFGHAHQGGTRDHAGINIETGIGYPTTCEQYRIFESYAWLHRLGGVAAREGADYEWVIPNYFDVDQWPLYQTSSDMMLPKRLVFFGRIGTVKGLDIVKAIAVERPDLEVVICGQGDPSPWLDPKVPNLTAIQPLRGRARAAFLGNALAILTPTRYIGPFEGVTVEANLVGTPAITSHFGCFTETIEQGWNGWRCRTLGDYLAAVARAERIDHHERMAIRDWAKRRYSMQVIGPQYAEVFQQITDVRIGKGWYTLTSKIGEAVSTKVESVAEPDDDEIISITAKGLASIGQSARADLATQTPDGRAIASVSEQRWQDAQHYEQAYWAQGGDPERKKFVDQREREQHTFYRGLMRISPETIHNKRILDIGCGPYSVGLDEDLDHSITHLIAVDPGRYAEEDEERYFAPSRAGWVTRLYLKAEELVDDERHVTGPVQRARIFAPVDEVWCYNLLQHVVDPAACIANASKMAKEGLRASTFRIFEWCNVASDAGHPHVLTKEYLREQLTQNGWSMWKEMSGTEQVTGWKATEFYAGVWVRV